MCAHKVGLTVTGPLELAICVSPIAVQRGNTEAFLAPADQIWVCCSPIFIFLCASFLQLNVELGGIVISDHTLASLLWGGGAASLSGKAMWQLQGITVSLKRHKKRGLIREECTSLCDCFKNTSSDSLKRRVTLHTSKGCEAIETWRPESYVNWNCYGRAVTLLVVFGDKEVGWAWYISPVFTCRTCFMLASSLFFVFFPLF